MKPTCRVLVCTLAVAALHAGTDGARAQSFSLGADIVSRYVWRGYDFGESMAVQPSLSFGSGAFEIGAWGSWSVSADGAGANENDLWVSFSFGPVSIGLTDYYFPAPLIHEEEEDHDHDHDHDDDSYEFRNFDAHTPEPYISYSGEHLEVMAAVAFAPGPEDGREGSFYIEAGVPFEHEGVEGRVHAGVVANASDFYGTDGAAIANLGLTVSKPIVVTDTFELPASVAFIWNPDIDRSYLVFGLSLSP